MLLDSQTKMFKLQVQGEQFRNTCLIQTKSKWEAASWILHSKHCHLSCSTHNVTPIHSNNEIFQVSFFLPPFVHLGNQFEHIKTIHHFAGIIYFLKESVIYLLLKLGFIIFTADFLFLQFHRINIREHCNRSCEICKISYFFHSC